MLVMALAEGSAQVCGTVPWRMDDPTRVHGIKHSWQLLADAVEEDRPMVVPSSKYTDRIPPDEAER